MGQLYVAALVTKVGHFYVAVDTSKVSVNITHRAPLDNIARGSVSSLWLDEKPDILGGCSQVGKDVVRRVR